MSACRSYRCTSKCYDDDCEIGPPGATGATGATGTTGVTGATGADGATGSAVRADNFIFGLTSYEDINLLSSESFWLVPGGDINPGITGHNITANYKVGTTTLPPSMAICYGYPFTLTHATIHLLDTSATPAWGITGPTVTLHSFCDISGGKPYGGSFMDISGLTGNCQVKSLLPTGLLVGTTGNIGRFLAVSCTPHVAVSKPCSISVAIGCVDKLEMPQ